MYTQTSLKPKFRILRGRFLHLFDSKQVEKISIGDHTPIFDFATRLESETYRNRLTQNAELGF